MSDLEAGVQIGDFKIERRLGAGGMGIVYLANQVSLNRTVALKVLSAALNRETDIARFRREAQAIAKLHHLGIAAVRFVGQDGLICYLAMEYIDGIPLRRLIHRLAALREPDKTLDAVVEEFSPGEVEAPAVRFDDATITFVPQPSTERQNPEPEMPTSEAMRLIGSPFYVQRCCEIIRDAGMWPFTSVVYFCSSVYHSPPCEPRHGRLVRIVGACRRSWTPNRSDSRRLRRPSHGSR